MIAGSGWLFSVTFLRMGLQGGRLFGKELSANAHHDVIALYNSARNVNADNKACNVDEAEDNHDNCLPYSGDDQGKMPEGAAPRPWKTKNKHVGNNEMFYIRALAQRKTKRAGNTAITKNTRGCATSRGCPRLRR